MFKPLSVITCPEVATQNYIHMTSLFSELLHCTVWRLNTNILEDHTASIFRAEECDEWKVDTDIMQGTKRGRGRGGYSSSQ